MSTHRHSYLFLALLLMPTLVVCAGDANSGPPASQLRNGSFDEDLPGPLAGWQVQGENYGRARIVGTPLESGPHSLELEAIGEGSSGNNSVMVFQLLNPSDFAGKTLELRASVRTAGAGVNLVLFTNEGMSNDFFQVLQSGSFVKRSTTLKMPKGASMLSVGLQIFGPAGSKAWIDDVALWVDGKPVGGEPTNNTAAGSGESPRIPATPPAVPATKQARTRPAAPGSDAAQMRVDASQPSRSIDPKLFCMHIEWVEEGLGLFDKNKNELRKEVVSLITPLKVGAFRFPGGIHADFYDWKQATGPRASRGKGYNAFTKVREPSDFGSDEFMKLVDLTGAEACITSNYGTGTAQQAGEWARYFAASKRPPGYWEVGNEIYLSGPTSTGSNSKEIFHTGKEYARDFQSFRSAIQAELPNSKVGMIGHIDNGAFDLSPGDNRNWTTDMLGALQGRADFMAVHNGYAPVIIDDSVRFTRESKRKDTYRAMYAAVHQTADNFDLLARSLEKLSPQNKDIPFAVTEFGPFFGISSKLDFHSDYVDQTRTLASAIYTASLLDVFIANPRVFMACYTNPIHRWYGSLITNADSGLVQTPTYYVYELYRSRFESQLLKSTLSGPSFNSPRIGVVAARQGSPTVMGQASMSPDGQRLTAMVINRSVDASVPFSLAVAGFDARSADCQLLGGAKANTRNGPALGKSTQQSNPGLQPRAVACSVDGGQLTIDLPENSILSVVLKR